MSLAGRIGGRHEHGCARAFAKRIEDPYWQENPCDCGAEPDAEKVRALEESHARHSWAFHGWRKNHSKKGCPACDIYWERLMEEATDEAE